MATEIATSAPSDAGLERGSGGRASRAALLVFALAALAAIPLYLWRGRHQWFYLDEWDFLAGRSLTNWHDLVRPHNEHWVTVPIIVYRLMWRLVGLHSYRPYQLMTITLHLSAACLLRVVMRRAGVRPWTATLAAILFVFLGSGHENVLWAFQIGFIASLVCGLVHLILADHDGAFDRRDAIGLCFGALALACSGVGVTLVACVGVATLLRRGWQSAAAHVLPLAALFLTWWAIWGRGAYANESGAFGDEVHAAVIGLANIFVQLGRNWIAAVAIVALLACGLLLARAAQTVPPFRTRAAASLGLLCGAPIFLAIVSAGRIGKAEIAVRIGVITSLDQATRAGRYVYLLVAFVLPALALAVDALLSRWRYLTPVIALLLVISLWGNIDAIGQTGLERFRLGQRDRVLAMSQAPFADQLPARTQPLRLEGPEVTLGWLRAGVRSGRIPAPRYDRRHLATVAMSMVLVQRKVALHGGCVRLQGSVRRRLPSGHSFAFAEGPISVALVYGGVASTPIVYSPTNGGALVARAGPLLLDVSPVRGLGVPRLCG